MGSTTDTETKRLCLALSLVGLLRPSRFFSLAHDDYTRLRLRCQVFLSLRFQVRRYVPVARAGLAVPHIVPTSAHFAPVAVNVNQRAIVGPTFTKWLVYSHFPP